SDRHLYCAGSQGRASLRPAGRAVDQVRVRYQHANGEGTRHRGAQFDPIARRRGDRMSTRRQFITLLGAAAAAKPLAAHAQQTRPADASPRIAFLTLGLQENSPAFVDGLRRLGYAQGRNLDIDYRYGPVEKLEPLARELIAFKPDILVASAPSAAIAFKG